jgi:hypothetical protein
VPVDHKKKKTGKARTRREKRDRQKPLVIIDTDNVALHKMFNEMRTVNHQIALERNSKKMEKIQKAAAVNNS